MQMNPPPDSAWQPLQQILVAMQTSQAAVMQAQSATLLAIQNSQAAMQASQAAMQTSQAAAIASLQSAVVAMQASLERVVAERQPAVHAAVRDGPSSNPPPEQDSAPVSMPVNPVDPAPMARTDDVPGPIAAPSQLRVGDRQVAPAHRAATHATGPGLVPPASSDFFSSADRPVVAAVSPPPPGPACQRHTPAHPVRMYAEPPVATARGGRVAAVPSPAALAAPSLPPFNPALFVHDVSIFRLSYISALGPKTSGMPFAFVRATRSP